MPVRLVSQEELPGPLAGYRLIERLGRGGFGEVWKVEAPGGFLKAAKFVFGDLEAMTRTAVRPSRNSRRFSRVQATFAIPTSSHSNDSTSSMASSSS